MKEIPPKALSRHVKGKNLARNSQHGFVKDKVCPTNLVILVTVRQTQRKTRLDGINFDFSKTHKNLPLYLCKQNSETEVA